jgi:ferritin-like metal-binding protein YciE
MARSIREQEAAMAERLAAGFDRAVAASLRDVQSSDLGRHLDHYLKDAYAIEAQALQLLDQAPALAREEGLRTVFAEHLEQTRAQQDSVRERLEARGGRRSRFRSTLLRVGSLNLAGFFEAQPDTPARIAGFLFAFEHHEIASYEMLRRVAERAGQEETARVAERIAAKERQAAAAIRTRFGPAMDAALPQGVSG